MGRTAGKPEHEREIRNHSPHTTENSNKTKRIIHNEVPFRRVNRLIMKEHVVTSRKMASMHNIITEEVSTLLCLLTSGVPHSCVLEVATFWKKGSLLWSNGSWGGASPSRLAAYSRPSPSGRRGSSKGGSAAYSRPSSGRSAASHEATAAFAKGWSDYPR